MIQDLLATGPSEPFMNQALIARRFSRGFTLLELMVVIVIIGVLAALIAPKILRPRRRGQGHRGARPTSPTS